MIGPITDVERRRWQRRAVRVLSDLLSGPGRELPLLRWTVARRAGLVGHVEERDRLKGRQQFEAWVQALGATRSPERPTGSTVHLHAIHENYDGLVTVALLADLDQDDEEHSNGR